MNGVPRRPTDVCVEQVLGDLGLLGIAASRGATAGKSGISHGGRERDCRRHASGATECAGRRAVELAAPHAVVARSLLPALDAHVLQAHACVHNVLYFCMRILLYALEYQPAPDEHL